MQAAWLKHIHSPGPCHIKEEKWEEPWWCPSLDRPGRKTVSISLKKIFSLSQAGAFTLQRVNTPDPTLSDQKFLLSRWTCISVPTLNCLDKSDLPEKAKERYEKTACIKSWLECCSPTLCSRCSSAFSFSPPPFALPFPPYLCEYRHGCY